MLSLRLVRVNRLLLLLVSCLFLLWVLPLGAFEGLGGYFSEKTISRGNSEIVIGRAGVNGDFEIGLGPIVTTTGASNIQSTGSTTAVLNGNVGNLNGFPEVEVWFEWGYDGSLGNILSLPNAISLGNVSDILTGFAPGSIVYYRLAGGADGINYGEILTFSTISAGWFTLAQVLPYIFLGISILMVLGLAYAGIPLIYALVMGAIIAITGIVGTSVIMVALQSLW